ncbi:MAG: hypothetical protein HOP36_05310 [Methyloglobulus sp.]|nr:hypothetical protein [Methyloglobulus sp.]
MALLNELDDIAHHTPDLENKLVLPTAKLVAQVKEQLNVEYQDMLSGLADATSFMVAAAKQLYAHPVETSSNWFGQIRNGSADLVAQAQGDAFPIYQHWLAQISTGKEMTLHYLQAFWDNPPTGHARNIGAGNPIGS